MRSIGVVTVARSDYGIYVPILRKIQAAPDLRLHLIVSGMHLSPEFGHTIDAIRADGFPIGDKIEMLLSSDTPEGISKSMGLGIIGFSQSFARQRPDILLVLGDRFEMYAAVIAALPFAMPIAHLHGGESTEGLIDEPIRHAITKMSHLHFASTETYRNRIVQMGEEPWRVEVSGAPALDNLNAMDILPAHALEKTIGMALTPPPLLVTFHPVTLEYERTSEHIAALCAALETIAHPVVFTYPNADTQGRHIIQAIDQYVQKHAKARAVANLGTQAYFSLMTHACAMVGNSSSGIIEAASFKLPVVNIGNRQRGRIRGRNVIDVDTRCDEIINAIQRAISPKFRSTLENLTNPYGDGRASERIVQILRDTPTGPKLITKRFHEIKVQPTSLSANTSAT